MTTFNLNLLFLKLFAFFCMFIDHLYKIQILSHHIIFVILGRLSFPIFLFLLVNNFFITSNPSQYKKRLLLFALLSQFPFNLFSFYVKGDINELNVLFTLLSCFLFLQLLTQNSKDKLSLIIKGELLLLFNLFCDYFLLSLLYTYFFYLFKKEKLTFNAVFFLLLAIYYVTILFYNIEQLFALLSFFIIFYFSKLPSKNILVSSKMKKFWQYFFYIIYPVHFFILIFIDVIFFSH